MISLRTVSNSRLFVAAGGLIALSISRPSHSMHNAPVMCDAAARYERACKLDLADVVAAFLIGR